MTIKEQIDSLYRINVLCHKLVRETHTLILKNGGIYGMLDSMQVKEIDLSLTPTINGHIELIEHLYKQMILSIGIHEEAGPFPSSDSIDAFRQAAPFGKTEDGSIIIDHNKPDTTNGKTN